jgi:hypothetical protein
MRYPGISLFQIWEKLSSSSFDQIPLSPSRSFIVPLSSFDGNFLVEIKEGTISL